MFVHELRAKQVLYTTEYLRKTVMKRSQLKTMYFKANSAERIWSCKKQKKFVVSCIIEKERNQVVLEQLKAKQSNKTKQFRKP